MNIVICGSTKFNDFTYRLKKYLLSKNHNIIIPSDVPYQKSNEILKQCENKVFYDGAIREADLVLIFNANGYIGLSTAMELRFALSLFKPVKLLFKPNNIEFQAMLKNKQYDLKIDNTYLKEVFTEIEIDNLNSEVIIK